MDEERFDRWTAGLGQSLSRRRLGGAAVGALTALGLTGNAGAKKKKKKKKKPVATCPGGCRGNEQCRSGKCIDPACGECPAGQECIYGLCQDPTCSRIGEDIVCPLNETCCQVAGAMFAGELAQPVCTPFQYVGFTENYCCMGPGATYHSWPSRSGCCEGNVDFLPNGDTRCCIFNREPDQGDPTLCCNREDGGNGQSVNGLCCQPSGQSCSSYDLCCNGEGCPGNAICP